MKLRPLFFCYDDQALVEAEDAWRVRDAGYGGVWASSVLFKFGGFTGMHFKVSNDNANSVVMALKAKGSTKCVVDDHRVRRARALADTTLRPARPPSLPPRRYGRASGRFTGKGEGAREYLGDLLM